MSSLPSASGVTIGLTHSKSVMTNGQIASIHRYPIDPLFFGTITYSNVLSVVDNVYRTTTISSGQELSRGIFVGDTHTVNTIPGEAIPTPIKTVVAKYGKQFYTILGNYYPIGTSIIVAQQTNLNISLPLTTAQSLLGTSVIVDGPAKTITTSAPMTISEIYDVTQAWLADTSTLNIAYGEPITTITGASYIISAGWKLKLGAQLTGGATLSGNVELLAIFNIDSLNVDGQLSFTIGGSYVINNSTIGEVINLVVPQVTINGVNTNITTIGANIVVNNVVTIKITVKDTSGAPIEGARVYIRRVSDSSVIINGLTDVSGTISLSYNYTGIDSVIGWARKSTTSPYYKQSIISGDINASGFSTTVSMVLDE